MKILNKIIEIATIAVTVLKTVLELLKEPSNKQLKSK